MKPHFLQKRRFQPQNNTGSNDSNNHKSLNKIINNGNPSPNPTLNADPTMAGGGGAVGVSTEQVVAPGTLALLLGTLVSD